MSNVFEKINKTLRKGNVYLIIVASLAALVVLASLFVFFFKSDNRGTPTTDVVNDNGSTLTVSDIYSGDVEIPKFSYALNTYETASFTSNSDGTITYPNSYKGVDVSEHQGDIDWAKVKDAGYDFAMLRVGYRGYTRGRIYDDTTFEANIKGATEQGLKVGLYFFSQAVTVAEAEEEASLVLSMIGDYKIDYPIAFDWEPVDDSSARTNSITGDEVSQIAAAFCDKISKADYNTAVYINKTQAYSFYNLDTIKSYDIWYAEYQPAPSLYYNFTMWQYSASGTVDGIDGTADLNISFKDYSN